MRTTQSRIVIIGFIPLIILSIVLSSCSTDQTAHEILSKTIISIDSIETIYYKQDMSRTNPNQIDDTIFRYREMYFKRMIRDSIVGVKGHWYLYNENKTRINYEDIYDGKRLIRKNNLNRTARRYDLIKFPEFKRYHFWSHNTLYGMQYTFKYILSNQDSYIIERLNDTSFMNKDCFQIGILLEDKTTMPGYATKLEPSEGSVIKTLFIIDKETYFPLRMKEEYYSAKKPDQKAFLDQAYFDIKFNMVIDEETRFNTSSESLRGYMTEEIKPQ